MMSFSEWLKIVEGTQAMTDVARRLGLADAEMRQAVETLAPGLLMGGYLRGFEGFKPDQASLAALMPTDEIRQMLAKQASTMSGLSETVLQDVMPVLATVMADAMTKLAAREEEPAAPDSASSDMGAAIGGMIATMFGLGPSKAAEPEPEIPSVAMFQDWMKAGQTVQSDYLKAVEDAVRRLSPKD